MSNDPIASMYKWQHLPQIPFTILTHVQHSHRHYSCIHTGRRWSIIVSPSTHRMIQLIHNNNHTTDIYKTLLNLLHLYRWLIIMYNRPIWKHMALAKLPAKFGCNQHICIIWIGKVSRFTNSYSTLVMQMNLPYFWEVFHILIQCATSVKMALCFQLSCLSFYNWPSSRSQYQSSLMV